MNSQNASSDLNIEFDLSLEKKYYKEKRDFVTKSALWGFTLTFQMIFCSFNLLNRSILNHQSKASYYFSRYTSMVWMSIGVLSLLLAVYYVYQSIKFYQKTRDKQGLLYSPIYHPIGWNLFYTCAACLIAYAALQSGVKLNKAAYDIKPMISVHNNLLGYLKTPILVVLWVIIIIMCWIILMNHYSKKSPSYWLSALTALLLVTGLIFTLCISTPAIKLNHVLFETDPQLYSFIGLCLVLLSTCGHDAYRLNHYNPEYDSFRHKVNQNQCLLSVFGSIFMLGIGGVYLFNDHRKLFEVTFVSKMLMLSFFFLGAGLMIARSVLIGHARHLLPWQSVCDEEHNHHTQVLSGN
jgi:hypothetical protein